MSDDGLEIVLSPIQLAAVLENDTLDEQSCLANRFWGAATVFAGALELVGGAGLLLVPEPTAVTKVAGGALAVHGLDTATTGFSQVVTCKVKYTLTSRAATAAAQALGADLQTAERVGFAADMVIPLAAGIAGAIRAIGVRGGTVVLAAEEAAGGHTIARHVGRTEEQLRARLAQQSRIPAASTFKTLGDAERVVSAALRANRIAIKTWAKTATAGQTKAFTYSASRAVGHGVVRSTGQLTEMSKVVVVLRKVITRDRVYFVLTSYPKP